MKKETHFGLFWLDETRKVPGHLVLEGQRGRLVLWDSEFFMVNKPTIHGTTSRGQCVSLFGCLESVPTSVQFKNAIGFEARVIFDLAVIGDGLHIESDEKAIVSIKFTFDELTSAVSDTSREFGALFDLPEELRKVLEENKPEWFRGSIGDGSILAFFTGEYCILPTTSTAIGNISIERGLSSQFTGLGMEERTYVRVDFASPLTAREVNERVRMLRFFFGLLFGHLPGLPRIHSATELPVDENTRPNYELRVHPVGELVLGEGVEGEVRSISDVLSSPRFCQDEFASIMTDWFSRNEDASRCAAIWQFLGCFHSESFSPDRHVGAANMFSLLPKCDRHYQNGQQIEDLGKIIAHRAKPVEDALASEFTLPHLDDVVEYAVNCRNYYVHGKNPKLNYEQGSIQVFLTQTLEFIFGASLLLECGWNIVRWKKRSNMHHPFSTYLQDYEASLRNCGLSTSSVAGRGNI